MPSLGSLASPGQPSLTWLLFDGPAVTLFGECQADAYGAMYEPIPQSETPIDRCDSQCPLEAMA